MIWQTQLHKKVEDEGANDKPGAKRATSQVDVNENFAVK